MKLRSLTVALFAMASVACGSTLAWRSIVADAALTGNALSLVTNASGEAYQLYPAGTQLKLRKLDTQGKALWTVGLDDTLPDTTGSSQLKLSSTGVVVGYGTPGGVAFVKALDANGTALWTSDLGTHTSESVADVVVSSGDTVTVALRQSGTRSSVIRLTSSGTIAWERNLGSCFLFCIPAVSVNDAGTTLATQGEATTTRSSLIDASGTLVWNKSRGTGLTAAGVIPSLATPTATGFVVTHPVSTWQYDLSGNETWALPYGGRARAASGPGGVLAVGNGKSLQTVDGATASPLLNIPLDQVETITQIEWTADGSRLVAMTTSRVADAAVIGTITDQFWPTLWTFDATGKELARYRGGVTITKSSDCNPFPTCGKVEVTPGDLWSSLSVTPTKRLVVSGIVRDVQRYAVAYKLK